MYNCTTTIVSIEIRKNEKNDYLVHTTPVSEIVSTYWNLLESRH